MRMSARVAIGLLLALGDCATSPRFRVTAPGKSDAAIQADANLCDKRVIGQPDPYGVFVKCLRDLGDNVELAAGSIPPPTHNTLTGLPAPSAAPSVPHPSNQAMWADYRAATAADQAHNYTEALRLWRQVDAEPEAYVVFPSLNSADLSQGHYPGRSMAEDYADKAKDYAEGLAFARGGIGRYYMYGLGVPKDYDEAARWYLKAVNTRDLTGTSGLLRNALRIQLGLLYAYGLGVPQDRQEARQLWVQGEGSNRYGTAEFIRLLDNNALPKTLEEPDLFRQEVHAAIVKLDEEDARKQAAAEQAAAARQLAETAAHQAADQAAWNRLPPQQKFDQCKSRCESNAYMCDFGNDWSNFVSGGSAFARAFNSDCTSEALSCMRECMSGP